MHLKLKHMHMTKTLHLWNDESLLIQKLWRNDYNYIIMLKINDKI